VTEQPEAVEGLDGTEVTYRERIWAPWPVWLVCAALTGTLGVAYGYPLGLAVGITTFTLTMGLVAWMLVATAPLVQVDDTVFRAGRARLPLRFVGRIAPLDPDQTRDVKGPKADPSAYLCTRGWTPRSVLVEVDDLDDPHPYWIVSTRRGTELAVALARARDRAKG
jgi:hypothetical protein